ncbi:hypothetical protein ACVILH_000107 [Bradyrhizobium sp. USDA 4353]
MTTRRVTWMLCTLIGFPAATLAGEAPRSAVSMRVAQSTCEQVISCGLKDGKWKEYPTPCAARDDGATNVRPKTGQSCEAATK